MLHMKLVLAVAVVLFLEVALVKSSCLFTKCSCTRTSMQCMNKNLKSIPSGNWPKIEDLWISGNKIKAIDADFDKRFPAVDYIAMWDNRVSVLDLNSFVGPGDQKRDITLNLANNYIERIIPVPEGVTVPTISSLTLESNRLTSIDRTTFLALPNLYFLSLSNNPLLVVAPGQPFLSNPILQLFYLDGVSAGDITGAFTDLPGLKYFYLRNNAITEIKEGTFPEDGVLVHLFLDGNPLQSLDVKALPVSGKLSVSDTPLVCQCAHAELAAWAHQQPLTLVDTCGGSSLCGFSSRTTR